MATTTMEKKNEFNIVCLNSTSCFRERKKSLNQFVGNSIWKLTC